MGPPGYTLLMLKGQQRAGKGLGPCARQVCAPALIFILLYIQQLHVPRPPPNLGLHPSLPGFPFTRNCSVYDLRLRFRHQVTLHKYMMKKKQIHELPPSD